MATRRSNTRGQERRSSAKPARAQELAGAAASIVRAAIQGTFPPGSWSWRIMRYVAADADHWSSQAWLSKATRKRFLCPRMNETNQPPIIAGEIDESVQQRIQDILDSARRSSSALRSISPSQGERNFRCVPVGAARNEGEQTPKLL
jgi:hypothetical protein